MNTRILELANEADVVIHGIFGKPMNVYELQKFAELIVKECATTILNNDIEKQEDYDVNHLFFNGWERGVIDSCQIIKKHFGVKE